MQTFRTPEKLVAIFVALAAVSVKAENPSPNNEQDRTAIERLHQQDIAATLSDDADQLAKLWDEEAVRLQSGSPPEIGKATIYVNDKRWQANLHGGRTLSYKPDLKDLQIVAGWAFEWGTFEVHFRESEHGSEKMLHGKMLRVLKKQSDGSWKFTRVMALIDAPPKT
jgi:ketosteroid isomerase-like protein